VGSTSNKGGRFLLFAPPTVESELQQLPSELRSCVHRNCESTHAALGFGLTQSQAHQPLAGHRLKPGCAADAKIDFPWTPHNPWLALLSKGRRCALPSTWQTDRQSSSR
jgi:hypothetical protein